MTRYFVTFHKYTSLADKVMPFTGMTRQEVWDAVIDEYPKAVFTIKSELEMYRSLRHIYANENQWVKFGTVCELYDVDIKTGTATDKVIAVYPVSENLRTYEEELDGKEDS